jgi:hypothetical protein
VEATIEGEGRPAVAALPCEGEVEVEVEGESTASAAAAQPPLRLRRGVWERSLGRVTRARSGGGGGGADGHNYRTTLKRLKLGKDNISRRHQEALGSLRKHLQPL